MSVVLQQHVQGYPYAPQQVSTIDPNLIPQKLAEFYGPPGNAMYTSGYHWNSTPHVYLNQPNVTILHSVQERYTELNTILWVNKTFPVVQSTNWKKLTTNIRMIDYMAEEAAPGSPVSFTTIQIDSTTSKMDWRGTGFQVPFLFNWTESGRRLWREGQIVCALSLIRSGLYTLWVDLINLEDPWFVWAVENKDPGQPLLDYMMTIKKFFWNKINLEHSFSLDKIVKQMMNNKDDARTSEFDTLIIHDYAEGLRWFRENTKNSEVGQYTPGDGGTNIPLADQRITNIGTKKIVVQTPIPKSGNLRSHPLENVCETGEHYISPMSTGFNNGFEHDIRMRAVRIFDAVSGQMEPINIGQAFREATRQAGTLEGGGPTAEWTRKTFPNAFKGEDAIDGSVRLADVFDPNSGWKIPQSRDVLKYNAETALRSVRDITSSTPQTEFDFITHFLDGATEYGVLKDTVTDQQLKTLCGRQSFHPLKANKFVVQPEQKSWTYAGTTDIINCTDYFISRKTANNHVQFMKTVDKIVDEKRLFRDTDRRLEFEFPDGRYTLENVPMSLVLYYLANNRPKLNLYKYTEEKGKDPPKEVYTLIEVPEGSLSSVKVNNPCNKLRDRLKKALYGQVNWDMLGYQSLLQMLYLLVPIMKEDGDCFKFNDNLTTLVSMGIETGFNTIIIRANIAYQGNSGYGVASGGRTAVRTRGFQSVIPHEDIPNQLHYFSVFEAQGSDIIDRKAWYPARDICLSGYLCGEDMTVVSELRGYFKSPKKSIAEWRSVGSCVVMFIPQGAKLPKYTTLINDSNKEWKSTSISEVNAGLYNSVLSGIFDVNVQLRSHVEMDKYSWEEKRKFSHLVIASGPCEVMDTDGKWKHRSGNSENSFAGDRCMEKRLGQEEGTRIVSQL
jgi:hypothetical protein